MISVHTFEIWSVIFSPDGQMVASGSGDGTVGLWEKNPGEEKKSEQRTLNGPYWYAVNSLAFPPDIPMVIPRFDNESVMAWNVKTCKPAYRDDFERYFKTHDCIHIFVEMLNPF